MSTLVAPCTTLYALEDDLLSLLDTAEGGIDPAQQAEFDAQLTEAITRTIDKRDRCGEFIRHCETQMDGCEAETKRLRTRKQSFEGAALRMRGYLAFVIESIGKDAKDKYKKLEGNRFSFSLRNNPPSVDVQDEGRLPSQYKSVSVTLSVDAWNDIIHACKVSAFEDAGMPLEEALKEAERYIDKRAIKRDLERGIEVPGADLKFGSTSLVIK
jgi:hypothetical protein